MSNLGLALGSGITSGLVVTVAQDFFQRRGRAAEVRERRRQDAARLVGPALASLRDLEPDSNVGALRGNVRSKEALDEKWTAWLTATGGLEVLGATHPGTEVDELCESVITKGTALLTRLHWAIEDGDAQEGDWWRETKSFRDDALGDARNLVRAVLDQPA